MWGFFIQSKFKLLDRLNVLYFMMMKIWHFILLLGLNLQYKIFSNFSFLPRHKDEYMDEMGDIVFLNCH